jgi:hypothetical protein
VKKLDFLIPDFTRVIWVSDQAKAVWEPRINRISQKVIELERESVLKLKRSALQVLSRADFPGAVTFCQQNNLVLLPLAVNGTTQNYSATSVPYQGGDYTIRVAIIRPNMLDEWLAAWKRQDDKWIGELLGFPECCVEFFQKYWKELGNVDTTWFMTGETENNEVEVRGYLACNILLRWLGVRSTPHLPCSFSCEATTGFFREFWSGHENTEEYNWLCEMLSWPAEWSALHGVARIKTPICEISTRTDSTGERYTVRKLGESYPAEGAAGLVFPYRRVQDMNSNHYLWLDNGFSSYHDMMRAHQVIENVLDKIVPTGFVDLGCGNGTLLHKLGVKFPTVPLIGVEKDEPKVERGKALYDGIEFLVHDLCNLPSIILPKDGCHVVICSINRLDEDPTLIQVLDKFDNLVIYSYDGKSIDTNLTDHYIAQSFYNSHGKANLLRRR